MFSKNQKKIKKKKKKKIQIFFLKFFFKNFLKKKKKNKKKKKKMDSTPHCSRVVPHPSTERAQTALTSVFGREPVHYG